ncbi:MAG: putative nucleotidyltransferase substrate binding domain-containing protein [Rhodospirillales bacterium]
MTDTLPLSPETVRPAQEAGRIEPRTAVFRMRVGQAMTAKPSAARTSDSLEAVVRMMDGADTSSVVLTDDTGRPAGIVTEQDITRRAAFRLPGNTPAADLMSHPVKSIDAGEYLYRAIAMMRRAGLRHMPVVDSLGVLVGMLDLHTALGFASRTLMEQVDSLTQDTDVDGNIRAKAAQVDLADQLFRDNIPATDIQALLSGLNLDIYRRVVDRNIAAMAEDGLGPPPVEFTVIVMGSGGRGESFLFPDQDNGFIIDDYPDDQHSRIDGWFINLAERMVMDLDRIGLPLCRGYVMATNPLWRKTLGQWRHQISLWSNKKSSTVLRHCDIFFDFRAAWGPAGKARALRAHVTGIAKGNALLLNQMFQSELDHEPALGWFRRFKTMSETDAPGFRGYLNLKHTGTLPLVEGVRLLTLREGTQAIPTLERIPALLAAGVLSTDEADDLTGAYRHISHLLLRQQIADFKSGKPVTNYVHPSVLTRREAHVLKDSFEAIRNFQVRIRGDFTGTVL